MIFALYLWWLELYPYPYSYPYSYSYSHSIYSFSYCWCSSTSFLVGGCCYYCIFYVCTCLIFVVLYYRWYWVEKWSGTVDLYRLRIISNNIIISSLIPTLLLIHYFNFTFFKSATISKKSHTISYFPSKTCLLNSPIAPLPVPKWLNIDHLRLFWLFIKFDLQKPNAAFICLYMELLFLMKIS